MTIEELNKLIKEELDAFFEAEEDGDDIEVTTDEPAAETGEEAMDLLRQIYDMIKPEIEGEEGGEEPEMDMEEPEDEGGEDMGDEEEGDEEAEEELDEEVLNEGFMEFFDTFNQVGGMMDGDVVNKLMSDVKFAKILIGTLTGWAALMGWEFRDNIKKTLQSLAAKAGGRIKDALMKLANSEEAMNQIKGNLDEAVDNHTFFRGDNVGRTVVKAKDVQGTREKASLKEGFDGAARFQKLANIKK